MLIKNPISLITWQFLLFLTRHPLGDDQNDSTIIGLFLEKTLQNTIKLDDTDQLVIIEENSTAIKMSDHKPALTDECRRAELLGTLTEDASPFLFPCAIEYSLICAAITYEVWKHSKLGPPAHLVHTASLPGNHPRSGVETPLMFINGSRRSPHHYSVDCTHSNRGLFSGIFVLVLTIISMVSFSSVKRKLLPGAPWFVMSPICIGPFHRSSEPRRLQGRCCYRG